MLSKGISKHGIEFVERALAYPPELRIAVREALALEWLQLERSSMAMMETEGDWTGSVLPERPPSRGGRVANGYSPAGNVRLGLRNSVAATMNVNDQRAAGGSLNTPAQDRMMDSLASSPAFDNSEHELQKLLGEHQALCEEVTTGVITNLEIPSLSRQTRLEEKEVLYPAYLINIVTREMLNGGFVEGFSWFMANVMRSIRSKVEGVLVSEGTTKLKGLGSLTVNSIPAAE